MDRAKAKQTVLAVGEPLSTAKAAMILLHGRGSSADDILTLVPELATPGVAYLAPQAAGGAWYPNRFMEPLATNEPYLSNALAGIAELIAVINANGLTTDKIVLLGFSQGACLALEFAARNARRYGGVAGLSGGLIGPKDTPRDYPGSLDNTPIFLGCSDVDFHIPKERVDESAQVLRQLGGSVTERLYRRMGHTINEDEISAVHNMMLTLLNGNFG